MNTTLIAHQWQKYLPKNYNLSYTIIFRIQGKGNKIQGATSPKYAKKAITRNNLIQ